MKRIGGGLRASTELLALRRKVTLRSTSPAALGEPVLKCLLRSQAGQLISLNFGSTCPCDLLSLARTAQSLSG